MAGRVSDTDRKDIEDALLAALLLIYQGEADKALAQLGQEEEQWHISPTARAALAAEVADVAGTVQSGINQRLEAAAQGGDDAPSEDQARQEIEEYNRDVLMPYLASFATHQALADVYQDTPSDQPGVSARDATLWQWRQNTDYKDDCTAAEAASPASWDELVAIGHGPPPAHRNCQCRLSPAGTS